MVLDFSPKKKAGEWDRAGRGEPVAMLEGTSSYLLSLTVI